MTTPSSIGPGAAARGFLARPMRLLIDGRWVEALSGRQFATYDPATGAVLARVAEAGAEDIDMAVRAARRALESAPWRDMTPADRSRLLWRLADLVEAHADELAELESLDNGKPVTLARNVDVASTAKLFRYFAGWPTKLEGATIPVSPSGGRRMLNYTRLEPVGVCGQIVPWNYPLSMAAWKLAPALAAGCTSVLKPAEQTPLTALRLGELVLEAGFPSGVVNIVPGFGATAGAALVAHPLVDKIAFTGSTQVGKQIAKACADTMKRLTLELGGKSPNVVLADADPAQAAAAAAQAIFANQGQTCTAGSRLYVHRKIFDQVIERVASHAARMVIGHGLDPATELGPLVSQAQWERVKGYVDLGAEQGGRVLAGGGRPASQGAGHFFEPTILVDTGDAARVVREEIFGPVLTALPWDDMDDLVAKANDSIYGLAAGIWTNDLKQAHVLAGALRAGTVWINCYNVTDPASPFGGMKQSGLGREMGRKVLDNYTEVKSVWVNLT